MCHDNTLNGHKYSLPGDPAAIGASRSLPPDVSHCKLPIGAQLASKHTTTVPTAQHFTTEVLIQQLQKKTVKYRSLQWRSNPYVS